MSDEGKIVVSGGAYGIENAAHRAVLAAGSDTIAVLASGVDRSHPQGQKDLLDRVRGVGSARSVRISGSPPGEQDIAHAQVPHGDPHEPRDLGRGEQIVSRDCGQSQLRHVWSPIYGRLVSAAPHRGQREGDATHLLVLRRDRRHRAAGTGLTIAM